MALNLICYGQIPITIYNASGPAGASQKRRQWKNQPLADDHGQEPP
jgi:hypothetical protein